MDLGKQKVVREILSRMSRPAPAGKDRHGAAVKADGTWGSFAPMLAAYISGRLARPILYISAHIDNADNAGDDLCIFAKDSTVLTLPVWQGGIDEKTTDATDEIGTERLRIALRVSDLAGTSAKKTASAKAGDNVSNLIISASVQALNQPVPSPDVIRGGGLELSVGQTVEPELIAGWLSDNGFEHVDMVDLPGQYARRGGIVDIFAPVMMCPDPAAATADGSIAARPEAVRIDFFGDTIESIRRIDLDTQRSSQPLEKVYIVASWGRQCFERTELFINLMPSDTIIIFEEPAEIAEVSDVFLNRVDDPSGLYPWEAIYKAAGRFDRLEINRFAAQGGDENLHLGIGSAQQFQQKASSIWKSKHSALEELLEQAGDKEVLLYCENDAEIRRVTEIVRQIRPEIPAGFHLLHGFIHEGFIVSQPGCVVISHHEIFGQYALRRRVRTIRAASPIDSMLDLEKGDYVVHISYGIGKFRGIETMEKGDTRDEYLKIEYADKQLVYVPVRNIYLVRKYVGAMPRRPPLSRLGSKKWDSQKEKVARGVEELAAGLLETQAKRRDMGGFAFSPDTVWQREFEESFIYQETPDQLKTAQEIKDDMEKTVPMDRLLCGDVGYGKTELAMRAAFKAVEAGKQVAVLVPTTVLCIQHGRTFSERFSDFPVRVEMVNRFTPAGKAKEIIADAKKGAVDILIGTHRLLSADIGFRDLGLLIIDEEQRFGVEHKERLKRFKVNVDVLTMTATPIPRTLHMSLLGLRDISSLATPPLDRRSIITKVCRFEPQLVRKAVINELGRDGQVFFVHNRVRSIDRMADEIHKIIGDPSITVDVAHGQMAKHQLEDAMIRFVLGRTNVLVCSAIIESGIDIPNANTIIINDADRFGLAQLHQLRGRVGRYKHRAYAYMLMPGSRPITPDAAKRLKAIEEYSQLGAGFRIALRDLQIRGAGNILGPEQSGHINTVGYELYCRLLADAVRRLRNEPVEETPSAVIDLGFSTYIPRSYITSDRQRMDIYRRIALAGTTRDLAILTEELTDLFGPVPSQVKMLIDMTELKILAGCHDIKSIVVSGPDVIFSCGDGTIATDLFARSPGRVSIPDKKSVYIRLEQSYFEPPTLISVIRKILTKKTGNL